ncbi:hypothetical protein [Nocardioides sp. KR10-350]|uniref:hypothetical protein n=1 Tax=Nocardioides cheoyonin TaxID=3156615 RepID=UPI0032B4FA6E
MRRLVVAVGLLLAAGVGAAVTTPAYAIPPGGAGSDTAGTSASVSPRTLTAGGTIGFTVSGFPAGETVYVKIDDGSFCSSKGVHGACVVHQQAIGASGTVSGSFVLPTDLEPGRHWLRFLASEEVTKDGQYAGVKPYTCRGNSDFTVVASGSTSGGTSPQTGGSASSTSASAAPTEAASQAPVGSAADPAASAAPSIAAAGVALEIPAPSGAAPSEPEASSSSASATASGTDTQTDQPAARAADTPADGRFPVVGVAGLALLCAIALALALRARARRR